MPREYLKQIIGAAVGIVIGLMILFIGFFKTLLLVALALVGWWLCGSREIPQSVIDWLSRLRFPWN